MHTKSEIELFLQSVQVAIFLQQKALILLSLRDNIAEPFDNWITQVDIYTCLTCFNFCQTMMYKIEVLSKMQKFLQTGPRKL